MRPNKETLFAGAGKRVVLFTILLQCRLRCLVWVYNYYPLSPYTNLIYIYDGDVEAAA